MPNKKNRLHKHGQVLRLVQEGRCTGYVLSVARPGQTTHMANAFDHFCLLIGQVPEWNPGGYWGVHDPKSVIAYQRLTGVVSLERRRGFGGRTGAAEWCQVVNRLAAFGFPQGTPATIGYGVGFDVKAGANIDDAMTEAKALVGPSPPCGLPPLNERRSSRQQLCGCIDPGTGKVRRYALVREGGSQARRASVGDVGAYQVTWVESFCPHTPKCTGVSTIEPDEYYLESYDLDEGEFPIAGDDGDEQREATQDGTKPTQPGLHILYRYWGFDVP